MAAVASDHSESQTTLQQAKEGRFEILGSHPEQKDSNACFVWGDSHSLAIVPVLAQLAEELKVQVQVAHHTSTPPCQDYVYPEKFDGMGRAAIEYNRTILKYIESSKIKRVLLVGAWDSYLTTPDFDMGLLSTIEQLNAIGVQVYLLQQVRLQPTFLPRSLALAEWHNWPQESLSCSRANYLKQQARFQLLQKPEVVKKVVLLDPTDLFYSPQGNGRIGVNSHDLAFRDDNHLSAKGGSLLRPVLTRFILGKP